MHHATTLSTRLAWVATLGILAAFASAGVAHAQGEDESSNEAFLENVRDVRDAAAGRIEDAQRAVDVACVGLAAEACLGTHVVPGLTGIVAELDAYATHLEGLSVPEAYADDVAVQVSWLRDAVDRVGDSVVAAGAYDEVALSSAFAARIDAMEELAAQLEPEWARSAFLTSFGDGADFLAFAGDVTADERAYLAAARSTAEAAASNFACFGRAISVAYGDTSSLLGALSECGAGTALPAIEAAVLALEPPPRFADEHAWWLAAQAELSRLDRLIGQAADEGDLTKFLVNNVRTSLAYRLQPNLDPAFIRGYPGPGFALDPSEPLARTPYGRSLHYALMDYSVLNPIVGVLQALQFPQVPREEAFPSVIELAPELQALNTELRSAVMALEPPPELLDDHAVIIEFFETYTEGLDDLVEAAEAGDVGATFAIENTSDVVFCDASRALSEAILPVAQAYFDPESAACS
jgi:hypothetical protein